jgi:hypothetical protein
LLSTENGRLPTVATRKYEQRRRAESAAETRRRILDALTTQLRTGPTVPLSLDQVARDAGVARSKHLRQGMRAGFAMFESDRRVWSALRAMGEMDPKSLGASLAVIEQNRTGGMAHLANRLAEQGELRPDVTVEEAADVLWVLTSFESFDLLRTARGLDFDTTVDRLVTVAERSLCT